MAILIYSAYLLLLGGALSSPLFSENKALRGASLKITNGTYTDITEFPYTATFLVANNIWGAGAILTKKWILTTAFNCLWVDPSFMSIRVGSSHWNENGTLFEVEKCVMHENYTGTYDYNIALVKVKGNITFNDTNTKKAALPAKARTVGATFTVTGWGDRSSIFQKETQLQAANQTVMNDTVCQSFYNLTGTTYFCANNTMAGPCVFDFGAPLAMSPKTVFGLYSGSNNCSDPADWPALYTDVFQFKTWINTNMKSS